MNLGPVAPIRFNPPPGVVATDYALWGYGAARPVHQFGAGVIGIVQPGYDHA